MNIHGIIEILSLYPAICLGVAGPRQLKYYLLYSTVRVHLWSPQNKSPERHRGGDPDTSVARYLDGKLVYLTSPRGKLFDMDRDGLLTEDEVATMLQNLALHHAHRAAGCDGSSSYGGTQYRGHR